ncbi:Aspartate carbamoyltransferase [uncultured archaeon]|nr:Aspartate carbamoyltransferase [uncultured archaeon]
MKGLLKQAKSAKPKAHSENSPKKGGFLTDIVSISDFSRGNIELVLENAAKMEKLPRDRKAQILKNFVVASLFFEPSTRTRLSFETAAQNLGARVVGFADAGVTSTKKGETLSDTIKMVENYADIIVMRHFLEGAAKRAAEISRRPIVNAGDGANQHPTQTLLDLYTMKKEFGKIDRLRICLAGDLKYGRTVHSLMYALSKFRDVTVYLVSPKSLEMPRHIIEETKHSLRIVETQSLEKYIKEFDVLYATRIQKERFPDEIEYEKLKNVYIITPELVAKARPGMRIMHPLPRVNEIEPEVDRMPAALYFSQAANGVPVREALLSMLKGAEK